jgi:hypothetical protein
MTQATDEAGQQEGLAGQASAKVQDAASVAQEKASELREQGAARVRDQLDQRSTQAGSQVRSLAQALRRSGDELQNDGNASAAQLAAQAADHIGRLGSYLEQKQGDDLMRDIETFARRRPWMLAGLGLLAGVAAARFIKASSEQRYGDYRRTSHQWPARQRMTAAGGGAALDRGELVAGTSEDPLARDPYANNR